MQTLSGLARMQKDVEKVKNALAQARIKGYGVMMPEREEILLDEPAGDPPRKQIRGKNEGAGSVH